MANDLAEVRCSCGRFYLFVAGLVIAMEGDPCREASVPADLCEEIPAAELAQVTIGGRPAAELPREIVRFLRADRWNEAMLRWAAEMINDAAGPRSTS